MKVLPLLESEVDTSIDFSPEEPLYRRIMESELIDGEIDPSRFNSISFDKTMRGAPSVLRAKYAKPFDVLHADCAWGKDRSHDLVDFILVRDLPAHIKSDDGRIFVFYPSHQPERTCGAHSVIASCLADDPAKTYVKPSKSVRYDLRVKLAVGFKPYVESAEN